MTIRGRIVGGVVVLTVIVVLLSGVTTVLTTRQQAIRSIDHEISGGVGPALQAFRQVGPGQGPRREEAIDRFFGQREVALIVVQEGRELFAVPAGTFTDPEPLPEIDLESLEPTRPHTVGSADGSVRYRVAVHEIPNGHVVLAGSLTGVDARSRALARRMLLIGVGMVLIAGVGTAGIVRRGMRPIDDMIETAEKVGDGTLSERVPIGDPDTEVGHLGAALNAMLERVEGAMVVREESEERLKRFASDASHELRTPLTSIRGYAELYRRGGDDPEQVARSFDRIESEGSRMARMLEDLLTLTRLDQGRGAEMVAVDLSALVDDAVADAKVVEPGRPIVWDRPSPIDVCGDPDLLRQVVGNLLANVRDHTDPDTPVEVSLGRESGGVRLVVADHGPGLPEGLAATAFERFSRGGPSGRGSGLGLSIVRSIVEAHNGAVTLTPSSPTGTTVTITLGSPLAGEGTAAR